MVTYETEKDKLILFLAGEVDHHRAGRMREEMEQYVEQFGCQHLVLDFSRVTFMDSSGIGLALSQYKKMRAAGSTMEIRGARGYTRRIFELAGIPAMIPFTDA
ncbi:MAG: STAS domain-containing protein [Eubacteriales bacterium]